MASEHYHVEVESADAAGSPVVTVSGELDIASAATLLGTFEAMRPFRHPVVLDVSGVSFIDSFGLRTLLVIREACLEDGHTVTLRGAGADFRSVLTLAGLVDAFDLDD